jgi:hypothetical protein
VKIHGAAVLLTIAGGLALSPAAYADEPETPIGRAEMEQDLRRFFEDDKQHSLLLFGVGVTAMLAGGALALRPGLTRAAAIPILGVGLGQAAVGGGIYLRTDAQVAELEAKLATDPAAAREAEYKRMTRLHIQYRLIQAAEAAMILGGATALIIGARRGSATLKGVGLGILIQGAVTLPLDLIADRGGERYRKSLSRFQVGLSALPSPGEKAPLALVVEGRF